MECGGSQPLDLSMGASLCHAVRDPRAQCRHVGRGVEAFVPCCSTLQTCPRRRNPESDTLPAVRSFWRLVLIWLTALALPIQGLAAAGGVHCLPANASASGGHAVVERLQTDDQSHACHSSGPTSEFGADSAGHAEADVQQVDPTSFSVKASATGHTCSACAACCAGAMLPSAVIKVPSPELSSEPAATVAAEPTSFIVSGPERPPRQVLA